MELRELHSQESCTDYNNYNGVHRSLRLRTVSAQDANQNGPQYDWGSFPDNSDQGDPSPPRNLRELPLHMELKRAVWRVQQMRVPVVTNWGSWRNKRSKQLNRLFEEVKAAFALVALWRKAIHKIGGHFGGGVQSYFLFLRFLVILNFLSFLLIAGFVLIPSIIFQSLSSNIALNYTLNFTGKEECFQYDPSTGALTVFYTYFLDLLSGTGFMEYSYLFYGYYNNTMVVTNGFSYNIPLAYLLTVSFYFIFCFICIIVRMGSVARVIAATGGGAVGGYSLLVFTGWDYGLQGQRATRLKQKSLNYQLQVDLEEERLKLESKSLTLGQTVALYSLRMILNLIVISLIVGALFGVAFATQFSQSQEQAGFVGLLLEYLPSIVIAAGNFVVPFLCDQIALLERHTPSTTIILALLRAVFLRLAGLGVLLFTLWSQITCMGTPDSDQCLPCQYNHEKYQCWETRVGQEMYKLTLFDFLTTIALLVLVEFPRRLLVDHCSLKMVQWVGRQEFLLAPNVLALVYSQAVVWTGALFCPLLPVINTVKFIIIFYCKKITLYQNCRPALRTFRSTSSNFFFLLVLLFGWILACVALIYSVAEIHPSWDCGPFRPLPSMWSVIPISISSLPQTSREFLFYVGSQPFSIPLFIFSCVLFCYVAALASVYGKSVDLLRNQHNLEARDKQFLVRQIEDQSKEPREPKQRQQKPAKRTVLYETTVPRGGHYNSAYDTTGESQMDLP